MRVLRCLLCLFGGLSIFIFAGCQSQQHKGVQCQFGSVTLWLQPNGKFVQDYTYVDPLLNPNDPPIGYGVHEGYWKLMLPGAGSPNGQAYVLFQNMYLSAAGPAPGASPAGYEQDRLVPLDQVPDAKGALTAAQLHALAASKNYHSKPLPQLPSPVIIIEPARESP